MKYFSVFNTDTGEFEVIKTDDVGGKGGGFVVSTTPPEDTSVLWINPEDNYEEPIPNGDNLLY